MQKLCKRANQTKLEVALAKIVLCIVIRFLLLERQLPESMPIDMVSNFMIKRMLNPIKS